MRQGKNTHWVILAYGTDSCELYVKDDTGSVLLDSTGTKIDIPLSFIYENVNLLGNKSLSEHVKSFMQLKGISIKTFIGNSRHLKITKKTIRPNISIFNKETDVKLKKDVLYRYSPC
ncbi:MAG: hypothetical protein K0B07_02045 [DPANN group archaeon]|nr:hypothetical protein [DPANN group archaeon]